jgi:hypothetical protein
MASRNYGMAYDTPYNKRLIEVLERYDAERDTNGEPAIFNNERLEGGSFVGQDGRGIYHPHLYHPILSRGAGDLDGGKFNFGKSLKSVLLEKLRCPYCERFRTICFTTRTERSNKTRKGLYR